MYSLNLCFDLDCIALWEGTYWTIARTLCVFYFCVWGCVYGLYVCVFVCVSVTVPYVKSVVLIHIFEVSSPTLWHFFPSYILITGVGRHETQQVRPECAETSAALYYSLKQGTWITCTWSAFQSDFTNTLAYV